MKTIQIDRKNTKMVAHRGVSWLKKENTLPAFQLAGESSYWGIETDVHKTADGKFVIIHDDSTLRVCGKDLIVENETFDTLRALRLYDIADRPTDENLYIPTLLEYIGVCKQYRKYAVVELKNSFAEEDVGKIVEEIKSADYLDKTVFISFDFDNLVHVRKFAPTQPVQFLTGKEIPEDWFEKVVAHGFDVDMLYKTLTPELLEKLHSAGIKVNCWTVNEPGIGIRLADWGVDYITTNILE